MQEESYEKAILFKKICLGLQSLDRKVRKQTYIALEKFLSSEEYDFTHQELRNIFSETHMYTLNGLRDKTETVREQAIKFVSFLFIEKLPLNDFYLTYLFPILVERIGSPELIEESEEIRLQLLQLLDCIIAKYSNTEQLKPFLNDAVTILAEIAKDKYPAIKELSCQTIINLAAALPRDFHMQAETLIKPVLTCFGHQRFKVRVSAINAVGEIVMHSSYKGLDEVVGPMAEKLFDQIPAVRCAVARNAARWLMDYRDRYSFFHKLLPLLLTGLNDEVIETRLEAADLWEKVGIQYQQENEKDLKDQLDYLIQSPKFYPRGIQRPNLGCRTLVRRNVSKLSGALARELMSWQEDVRVRCSQLLCSLALHAEEGITQNLQDLLSAMYFAARDDDPRVVANIVQASEIIGCFVRFETWCELFLPLVEEVPHFGHLTVLRGLVEGSPKEMITANVESVSKALAEDYVCCSRKNKYQAELLKCVQALSKKHSHGISNSTGYNLFKIIISLISLKHPDNESVLNLDLLEDLRTALELNDTKDLWILYAGDLLRHIRTDTKLWTTVTDQACIFWTIVASSDEAFGKNLDVMGEILTEVLDNETDAEVRLKTFYVLSTAFEKKDVIFRNAGGVSGFLEKMIQGVFVPSLVWHAGATAEAIRTMAASCLQYALLPHPDVDLFSSESVRPVVDKLLPLLISLAEDASYRSRQIAVECLVLLKENCGKKGVWTREDLITVYPEILKRLDDPTEKVRLSSLRNLPALFRDVPEDFKNPTFRAHHELIMDTFLTHFDDDNEVIQQMVYEILEVLARVNKKELVDKLKRHKPLLRNQSGCDRLLSDFEGLTISDVS